MFLIIKRIILFLISNSRSFIIVFAIMKQMYGNMWNIRHLRNRFCVYRQSLLVKRFVSHFASGSYLQPAADRL